MSESLPEILKNGLKSDRCYRTPRDRVATSRFSPDLAKACKFHTRNLMESREGIFTFGVLLLEAGVDAASRQSRVAILDSLIGSGRVAMVGSL